MNKRLVSIDNILEYLQKKDVEFLYKGDESLVVEGYSSLTHYRKGTLTWCKSKENWSNLQDVRLCVVQDNVHISAKNQIVCKESKRVFFMLLDYFWGDEKNGGNRIGMNTVIGKNVEIGEGVIVGNNCSIEGNISIGPNTYISDNVVIKGKVKIGSNCIIQACSVIGEDGFGCYEDENHKKTMIKHYGGVQIGNDVFVGAHTNIAKGTLDDTIIYDGVKIAPSTHIGHNGCIGEDTLVICSQLYGSVSVGKDAYIVGSIVKNQTVIEDYAMVGMGSVVNKNVEKNKLVVGTPAKVIRERYENYE